MADSWVRIAGGEGARPLGDATPFVVGVIANLSACKGCQRWRERIAGRFVEVDRDEIDGLLARIAPTLDLDLPGVPAFSITAFEHFRPEGLATRIAPVAALLAAREGADAPDFAASLATDGAHRPAPPAPSAEVSLDSLLEREPLAPAGRSVDPALDRLVRAIADASAASGDPAVRAARVAAVDAELGRRLREVLHHPRFQAFEAAWRSLRELVMHAETGERIRIQVLDIAREDLLAELDAGVAPEATRLHCLVVEEAKQTPGHTPFSLLLADFAFGLGDGDVRLLHHLGAIAAGAEVPVLAAADTEIWQRAIGGKLASEPVWTQVQAGPGSDRLALACPRVLLRLPYGPDTDPVEGFAFEEEATADTPERYCWGNPGFLVTRAILESVAETDSAAGADHFRHFEGLPLHAHRSREGAASLGPAERVFSDREIETFGANGLICVSGARGRDSILLHGLPRIGER